MGGLDGPMGTGDYVMVAYIVGAVIIVGIVIRIILRMKGPIG